MKKDLNKNVRNSYIVLFFLLFSFVCIDIDMLSAATVEDDKWSFEFSGVSLSEAVNKIGSTSGIEIFVIGDMDTRSITKSYNNSPIESILLDVFNGENHAVLFQYDDAGLAAINIWILPEGEDRVIHSDIFNNNTSVSLPVIKNKRIQRYEHRSRVSRIATVKSITKTSDTIATKKNYSYSSISFTKKDSSTSENNLSDSVTVDIPSPANTSEAVDIVPLADIVTTLGLEPPPMPPGLSF